MSNSIQHIMLDIQYDKRHVWIKQILIWITRHWIGPYRLIILPCLFPYGGSSWARSMASYDQSGRTTQVWAVIQVPTWLICFGTLSCLQEVCPRHDNALARQGNRQDKTIAIYRAYLIPFYECWCIFIDMSFLRSDIEYHMLNNIICRFNIIWFFCLIF